MRGAVAQNSEEYREQDLINEHASLVKRIAWHLMARLPSSVQVDDLIQAGLIGLMEALRLYDASQGASFETYATIRIRGAMLDELRNTNWSPRSFHKRMRALGQAVSAIENREGRAATPREVADALDLSLDEYHKWVLEANNQFFFSIDDLDGFDTPSNDGMDSTYAKVEREEFRDHLAAVIETLSEREQTILALYYDKELTLKEIGQVFGISESRVCQKHGELAIKIRSRMDDWNA